MRALGSERPGAETAPRLLNVGCGRRAHPAWINVDAAPLVPGVLAHDVRRALPFPTGHFDAVYHSHLLEHLSESEGASFLAECHRVLRPGGIVRVVVPDLEGIATAYLSALEAARQGQPGGAERHRWMVLELMDQATRHESGGAIPEFLRTTTEAGRRFAIDRWGSEVEQMLGSQTPRRSIVEVLASVVRRGGWRAGLSSLLGERWRVGQFRLAGEVHRWMYDTYSLTLALEAAGFVSVRSVSAVESTIPGWAGFRLDADASGRPHKPDSVYVEAVKPGEAGSRR